MKTISVLFTACAVSASLYRLGREVETSGSTGMDAARGSPADGEHGLRAGLG